MLHSPPRAPRPRLLAPTVALALSGGVLALTVTVLDPGGLRAHLADQQLAALRSGTVEALTIALGIAALAAVAGALLGTRLGVALRSRPRSRWSLAFGVLALLPLAAPPLVIALGLERLVEAGTWVEALPAVGLLGATSRAALLLGLAHLPAAVALVTVVVIAASGSADAAMLEAARLLGAGSVRRFLSFELPAAAPAGLLGLALSFLLVATSLAGTLSAGSGVPS